MTQSATNTPRLLLDAMITPKVAENLRRAGYDVISTHEVSLSDDASDEEVLVFATEHHRTVVTFNSVDFAIKAAEWFEQSKEHAGIVCSTELQDVGEIQRRLTNLLQHQTAEGLYNLTLFLNIYQ